MEMAVADLRGKHGQHNLQNVGPCQIGLLGQLTKICKRNWMGRLTRGRGTKIMVVSCGKFLPNSNKLEVSRARFWTVWRRYYVGSIKEKVRGSMGSLNYSKKGWWWKVWLGWLGYVLAEN